MAWDETTGIDAVDEQLRRMGINPSILQGLPPVRLGGGGPPPRATGQLSQPAAGGAAPTTNLPPVSLTNVPAVPVKDNSAAEPVRAALAQTSGDATSAATPNTPPVRLSAAPNSNLPASIEQLKENPQNLFQTPAVRLSNGSSPQDPTAPQSASAAGNALAMLAAARMNGGGDATGSGAVRPRTPEEEYRDTLNKEPTRDQFPTSKLPMWRKVLGLSLAALSGKNAEPLAEKILNGPEQRAEGKFDQAHQQWEGKLGNFMKAATLRHLNTEDENLRSEIDARNGKGDEHAKLADLYADAVKKAAQEGRDPLQDPDVKRYGDAIQNIQREPAGRGGGDLENTPFKLWRQQHPNADVSEYFKLQPEARNAAKPPKEERRLTPGQKMVAARKYKAELSKIEDEFRERQSGTYVDRRSGEMLPAMTKEELSRRKQDAEDAYKDELEAGGEKVSRYDYGTQGNGAAARNSTDAAASAGGKTAPQHQVGDEVIYKGQRHRIDGIKNGKAQLSAPLGPA
jgi:hypothetical protein